VVSDETLLHLRERIVSFAASRAIGQTGERYQRIIRLKLERKTIAGIQALLGVRSINPVYTWDYRCRAHLLELMGGSRKEKR
jgi:hypothetical protein